MSISDDFFSASVIGEHSVDLADSPRTGVDKIFEIEVDNMLLGGAGPSLCLRIHNERYIDDIDMRQRLPETVHFRIAASTYTQ
ncbi:hypothetical protein GQ600_24552 [Phytophthora cactorum]|nr:hypothetical protein GQ600_24552 [Phytophthora cactorum]